jgi:hypothetical protein
MFGFARIVVSKESLGIRFENVGHRSKFNLIMERFNQSFPLKEWDSTSRMWRMPPSDLQTLEAFCVNTFGTKAYNIEYQLITI